MYRKETLECFEDLSGMYVIPSIEHNQHIHEFMSNLRWNQDSNSQNYLFLNLSCKYSIYIRTVSYYYFERGFDVFDFLQKTKEGIWLYYYDTSNWLVFVRFWRKSTTTKNNFEINWPLDARIKLLVVFWSIWRHQKDILKLPDL